MTSRQTPETVKEGYGVGWSTGGTFGHGGAVATNMTIDPQRGLITVFLVTSMGARSLVPTRWQSMAELSYEFIANMIRDNVGSEGKKYFPFIFSLFMFILFCNLIGMIPYTFTVTSHIIVTFALALLIEAFIRTFGGRWDFR